MATLTLLDELLVGLGFDYNPDDIREFNKDISNTVDTVKKLVKIMAAGAAAITTFTVVSTQATDEQGKLANEIGDTVGNIDALQFAATMAGGTADGMASSLQQLAIRSAEAARGVGSGVEAFGLLGLSVTDAQGNLKPVSNLLVEISKNFEKISKSEQLELADKLGIRDSIRLLQSGSDSINELVSEARRLGVTTAEDAAISADFQDSLVRLWKIVKQVSRVISRSLAPVLGSIVTSFTDWWKLNKDIIEQNIPVWIDQATRAIKLLAIAAGAFISLKLLAHIGLLVGAMKGLAIASLAANVAAFLLPATVGAAIVSFAALLEDAKVFFEGGESFIGDMVEKFPLWAGEIKLVAKTLNLIGNGFSDIIELGRILFGLFTGDTWEEFSSNLSKWFSSFTEIKWVMEQFESLSKSIMSIWNTITNSINSITLPGISDSLLSFMKGIGSVFGFTQKIEDVPEAFSLLGNIESLRKNLSESGLEPRASIKSGDRTFVDKIDIKVDGAGDPALVAENVLAVFKQASQDLNSAVYQ